MTDFTSFSQLRALCLDMPGGHPAAGAAVAAREATLTKPLKSRGRLKEFVAFLAHWQGSSPPRLHAELKSRFAHFLQVRPCPGRSRPPVVRRQARR